MSAGRFLVFCEDEVVGEIFTAIAAVVRTRANKAHRVSVAAIMKKLKTTDEDVKEMVVCVMQKLESCRLIVRDAGGIAGRPDDFVACAAAEILVTHDAQFAVRGDEDPLELTLMEKRVARALIARQGQLIQNSFDTWFREEFANQSEASRTEDEVSELKMAMLASSYIVEGDDGELMVPLCTFWRPVLEHLQDAEPEVLEHAEPRAGVRGMRRSAVDMAVDFGQSLTQNRRDVDDPGLRRLQARIRAVW